MTTTTDQTIDRANRVLNALHEARGALIELLDAFHDCYFSGPGGTYDRDNAIKVAYHLAYSSNVFHDGSPVPLLATDHGDDLLRHAADARQGIKEFAADLIGEVPADEPDAA
jgi:hypothetical protein